MKYTSVAATNARGFAKVTLRTGDNYAEGIIDASGKEVIPPRTELLVNAIDGATALVQKGRGFVFVDLERQRADPSHLDKARVYQFAEHYSCGLAMVTLDDAWFYIDPAGNPCFNATYNFAESFHNDRALVMNGEHKRIIDTKGHVVAELKYDQVNLYSPWRWQVTKIKNDVYWSGFVDLDGKEVVPLIYDEMGYYDPEVKRTRAGIGNKLGFLDEYAKVAIPIQYDYAEIFSRGKARVMLGGRNFFIDPSGKEVPD
jgi:hypothetical protein